MYYTSFVVEANVHKYRQNNNNNNENTKADIIDVTAHVP